jgi:ATP-binding cassette subfamily F protein 3
MYRSPGLQIGWYSQEHEGVDLDRTPLEQARAIKVGTDGEVRAFLHQYLLGPEHVLRPAGELSYGERARVALALLAIGGANLLLLDEPMNHLDITAREELEQAIDAASVAMVMSSHDRYSLDRLGVELIDVERWRVR